IDAGLEVKMIDANLSVAKLMGTNRRYIDQLLPNWEQYYASSITALFNFADTVVVTTNEKIHREWIEQYGQDKQIIQLA
ncbi:MAG: hypothetical protein AAGD05_19440, partial [Bacteroidota bacterium]